MFRRFLQRLKFLNHSSYSNEASYIVFDRSSDVRIAKDCEVLINGGVLKIGGSLPDSIELPSLNKTRIVMEENSKLILNGNVYIASGTFIHIKKNAVLTFEGENFIGHNNFIRCSEVVTIGKNSSSSWGVTLIDSDGHSLYRDDGKALRSMYKPLLIGNNVGLQMNVTVPRGVSIGANALIGANTVIREDISENTLVYETIILKEKRGISAGLQFSN